ncbi:MAG TPA: Rieske (2Fe-2S) protein [Pyrinomonadaceae bacterium]|nr:Rieske (2Fe-2S) protein [Pyrinomonadaceae bacterium]
MKSDLAQAIDKVLSDEKDVRVATAPYQAEFPYERDDEAQVTRREFCNFLFLTSTALFLGSAGFAGKLAYNSTLTETFAPLMIEGSSTLEPGNSLNFFYPGDNDTAILIRAADGQYYAFEQKCTHLTCPVYYSKQNDRLECPCHEGGFDVHTGSVLYGPPPRPLGVIEIEVRGNEVWAVGMRKIEEHDNA